MKARGTKHRVLLVIITLALMNMVWAASHQGHKADGPVSLTHLQSTTVPNAIKALAEAKRAIQAGHREHALAELAKIETALMVAQKTLDVQVGPKFVNATCPMMGHPIKPDKVTADLVRVYQGKRIAFCCDGCPQKWDELTRIEKVAKLAEAMPKPGEGQSHEHRH